MLFTKKPFWVFLLCGILSYLFICRFPHTWTFPHDKQIKIGNPSRVLLVDTDSCKIPDFDPFDKSIARFIERKGKMNCTGKPSITFEEGAMLRLNWTIIKGFYKGDFKYCKYQPINRGPKKDDFDFIYGSFEDSFSSDVRSKHEHVRVYCYNKRDEEIYINFHAIIIPKPQLEKHSNARFRQYIRKHKPKETLNVLMLGMDSMSHLNFVRQMPKTRQFLLRELKGIEMLGYTKVADNTYLNLVPMTIGKYHEELGWNSSMTFDKYNLIWKQFSKNGYKTLYAEDSPNGATFVYLKKGFKNTPTDYYYRPLPVLMLKSKSLWNQDHHCVGDRMETGILLKYVQDFVTQNKHKPNFVFAFVTLLTHDYLNNACMADDLYFHFMESLKNEGILNNTVLIYFSDHGMRYGEIRKTFIGKLEGRLPMLTVVFPSWFMSKYPDILKNLKLNSKRLSTAFDVHETLKDILYFDGNVSNTGKVNRGISLLREIPSSRTCVDASILPHWCMCFSNEKLLNTSKTSFDVAASLLSHINKDLHNYKQKCAELRLSYIKEATRLNPDDIILPSNSSLTGHTINRTDHNGEKTDAYSLFQLSIVTNPGGGMFEGTVAYNLVTHNYSMAGDISRINAYGNQSECIHNFHLRKFCFCISNT